MSTFSRYAGALVLFCSGSAIYADNNTSKQNDAYNTNSSQSQNPLTDSAFLNSFYANLNLGFADSSMRFGSLNAKKWQGFALDADAGYQFSKYFAAEVGLLYLNTPNHDFSLTVAGKAILPVSQNFDLYAKAGYVFAYNKTTIEGGGEYFLNNKVSLNLGVERIIDKATIGKVGIGYHFGG